MTSPQQPLIERLEAATKMRGLAPVAVGHDDPETVGRIAGPLCDEIGKLRALCREAADTLSSQARQIEAARKALEWIDSHGDGRPSNMNPFAFGARRRAREALALIEKERER